MEIDNIKKELEKRGEKKGDKRRIDYLKLSLNNLEKQQKRDTHLEKEVKQLLVKELKENGCTKVY